MTTKEHLSKHDREIASIRALLKQGMKMVVAFQEENRSFQGENRKFHKEVRTAVMELKDSHKRLAESLIRPINGHKKEK